MTLRARTTLFATAVTGLVLVAAAVVLVATLSAQLTRAGDEADRAQVHDLLDLAAAGELSATIDTLGDESVAQAVDADGAVIAASPNVAGEPAIAGALSEASNRLEQRTVDGPDDDETEQYRVWIGRGPSPDGSVTVLVGRSEESVDEATRTLRGSLMVGVPGLLVLLAAVIWLVVGRALDRIDQITTTVATIDGSDLGRRVPETAADDEVGRLATTMNRMLERLDDAARRQLAFVADASHDLQSPLTGLRTQLEVALAHPDEVDVESWARQLLASSAEMELLVQDLLTLAVAEGETSTAPPPAARPRPGSCSRKPPRARPATQVRIDTAGVSAAPVRGDPSALRRLTRNLLDNAVRHASQRVRSRSAPDPAAVVLDIVDDGAGVPDEDRDRVFDRFYRGDPADRGHGTGSGLGLAIARRVAERHGGTVTMLPGAPGEGAHFRVTLPIPG